MRNLLAIMLLLIVGCSKPSMNSGLHLESGVPDALTSKIRLADSIYLTNDKVIGARYESRVSQELRHPRRNSQPLTVGAIYRTGAKEQNTRYPEQGLILRYSPGLPNGKDGGKIVEECYSIFGGVLYYNDFFIPAELVVRWIVQNPDDKAAISDNRLDGGPPDLINEIEPTIILAVMEAATEPKSEENAGAPGYKSSGLVQFHLEGDDVPGNERRLIVVGNGPMVPDFRSRWAADERLSKLKVMLVMNCDRKGASTDLSKVRRIRFVVNNNVKDDEDQQAIVEVVDRVPTLTFLMEKDSSLWKCVKRDISIGLDEAAVGKPGSAADPGTADPRKPGKPPEPDQPPH